MTDQMNTPDHASISRIGAPAEAASAPRIAVYALDASDEDRAALTAAVAVAYPGATLTPGPRGAELAANAAGLTLCVLLTNAASGLEAELATRPAGLPLVAVGAQPAATARPDVWLRDAAPEVLGAVLRALVARGAAAAGLAPRADDDLAAQVMAPPIIAYRDAKARFEGAYYSRLLRLAGGNISLAAKLAHKTRKEVYDAMKRLGLRLTEYRGASA